MSTRTATRGGKATGGKPGAIAVTETEAVFQQESLALDQVRQWTEAASGAAGAKDRDAALAGLQAALKKAAVASDKRRGRSLQPDNPIRWVFRKIRPGTPPPTVLRTITPDPGEAVMRSTEQLASEVVPAISSDFHLGLMLRRFRHLIDEGEGWAAIAEHQMIRDHIALIVTHYFERKKVRRITVQARSHIEGDTARVWIGIQHGRHEATRWLEVKLT